jgi:hypothetical protein
MAAQDTVEKSSTKDSVLPSCKLHFLVDERVILQNLQGAILFS